MRDYNFIETLKNFPFVRKIILFGSRARGDHHEKSDIDLAIEAPEATQKDWLEIKNIIENADTLLKIDCVRLDEISENSALRKNIEKDGVVLYEKNEY